MMPSTYAQLSGAMAEVKKRVPDWQPASMLDLGTGPGTALWAAQEIWPSLQKMTALEKEPAFIKLGKRLAEASSSQALKKTVWKQFNLKNKPPLEDNLYDLVVIGHVLNEMEPDLQRYIVSYAWEKCKGLLLIVEPGTSVAFPLVKEMRSYLLKLGAKTIAPCTHDQECPLVNDWCHFPQRITRPPFQRRAKSGTAGWEESKFSYAAMAKFPPAAAAWGRLIHQPDVQKGYVQLTVSSQGEILTPAALKRNRDKFKSFSDYKWGDLIIDPPEEDG
jgi:ribosomal protein RSM22 (predicted rRNA methylase)